MKLKVLAAAVLALLGCMSCSASEKDPESPCNRPLLDSMTALATVEGQTGVPLTKMLFIDPGPGPTPSYKPISFSAQVQSEDRGKPLIARVIADYMVSQHPVIGGGDVLQPSTCSDARTIQAVLSPYEVAQLGIGCHQVALVVSHAFDNQTFQPMDPADEAFLVWWILIEHAGTTPASSCPPGMPAPTGDGG